MTATPDRRYAQLMAAFVELQAAAQRVVDETDRIHDSEPWPVKYRAPYGAIVELRQLLAKFTVLAIIIGGVFAAGCAKGVFCQ